MTLLNIFLNDPFQFTQNAKLKHITDLIKLANENYYNKEKSIMKDEEYDLLKDELKKRKPNHILLKQVGVMVHTKNKVKLPYYMGTMNKLKPDDESINKWLNKYKGPYVLSDKLDGMSGLMVYNKNENMKLYTRGTHIEGRDISSIVEYLNIPKLNMKLVVRGELIISKSNFNKYGNNYANSRAMVSGLVNKKKPTEEELNIIDFVVYEVLEPRDKISNQLKLLRELKFNVVEYNKSKTIDIEYLSEHLKERKKNKKYDIDGIIICDDNLYPVNGDKYPKYAFAYKELLEDTIVEAKVKDVEWRLSKDGLIKPRVLIEETLISGIKINYLTGHHAKYIVNNGIGKGAIIKITRAGEVIPYIMDVIKKVEPDLPKIPYKWNSSKVNFVLDEDGNNKDILIKNMVHFFKKLEIKNIDEKLIIKLIDNGYNTINKILNMSVDDFLKLDGFQEKLANKIYDNIEDGIKKVELSKLMTASNIFGGGLGIKKLSLVVNNIPNILELDKSKNELIEIIKEIEGFDTKTANQFSEKLNKFKSFLNKNNNITFIVPIKNKGNKLNNIKIVFSGFRDKELEKKIKNEGGNIVSSVSKNTNLLITNDLSNISSKFKQAQKFNIEIITKENFIKKFNL